ncbi:hypothetical protein N7G274_001023 [Stereocaulon virgatum]|uniref:Uncharacterized protein n=1 Tax=Stereocaulon virgatum TaxID=373712 RepID=A0ABR4ANH8_9LECA
MSSISYFAPAFNSASRLAGLESPTGDHSKKRKRGAAAFESESDARPSGAGSSNGEPSQFTGYPSRTTQSPVMSGELAKGQHAAFRSESSARPFEVRLPESSHRSFRHRFQKGSYSRPKQDIADELATLRPPLLFTKGPADTTGTDVSGNSGVRQRHLAAVTAILHRSLLEGEFVRAGRAWGMLLRAESSGHTMDLRTNDRWGIGAEVLLRQSRGIGDTDRATSCWFSREGLEQAKAYYERLVLQYPYRKVAPNATGPLDFYIAMFSLWIYSVNEQHLLELTDVVKTAQTVHRSDRSKNDESESDSISSSSLPHMQLRESQRRGQIRQKTLNCAQEIAARLEELLVSPPYIDNSRFQELRGMVAMWIGDLSVVELTSENGSI